MSSVSVKCLGTLAETLVFYNSEKDTEQEEKQNRYRTKEKNPLPSPKTATCFTFR